MTETTTTPDRGAAWTEGPAPSDPAGAAPATGFYRNGADATPSSFGDHPADGDYDWAAIAERAAAEKTGGGTAGGG